MTGLRSRLAGLCVLAVIACDGDQGVDPPFVDGSGFSILTLLHGTEEGAVELTRDVAVDGQGNVYVTGGTSDPGFPTTPNAYQRTFGQGKPATSTGSQGSWDVFVMKFTPDGQLVWSTLIGGGNHDRAFAIEVDGSGVYVAGRAGEGFPTTAGVIQPAFAGDDRPSSSDGKQDGFIAKLSLDGRSLIWSTYFGGQADDFIRDLAIGSNGDVYPALASVKDDFPYITAGAFQQSNRGAADGVACRVAAGATQVRWCTYIGGSARDGWNPSVRVDGSGNVYYLQGTSSPDAPTTEGAFQATSRGTPDVHLTKLSPQGSLLFATFFGGSGEEDTETHNLWVSSSGDAYIAASTLSDDLPVTDGAFQGRHGGGLDAFVARLSADGRQLLGSTYLGGGASDEMEGIGMDGNGNVVVTGNTAGGSFLGSAGAPQLTVTGGQDGFIVMLSPGLTSVTRATFIGGSALDAARGVAVDVQRNVIYVGGDTQSANFPTLGSAFLRTFNGSDGFLAGWRY